MGGQQRIASHLRAHLTVPQDKVRQHREDRFAPRALDTPDGEPTQPETGIVGVAGQAPALAAAGLVGELKANREDTGKHAFDKRLAIAKQLIVERFILKINGDGPVFTGRFGWAWYVSPPVQMVFTADGTPWG